MAFVVQNQIPRSSFPPSPTAGIMHKEELSSCLDLMTISDVANANDNPLMPERHKRKKTQKATIESLYESSEAQSSVLERAKEVEARLDPKFPFMHKVMVPSAVTGGYCLNIPKNFCSEHLPKEDTMMDLEDENGIEVKAKYLVVKGGLSGGWRGFSISHRLLQGDIVYFQLVTPSKFKVYIVRSNGCGNVGCNLGLTRLDTSNTCITQMDTDHAGAIIPYGRNLKPIPEENAIAIDTKSGPHSESSENDSEDISFEFLDELRLSESGVTFKEVNGVEKFSVHVNGLIINSELSKYILSKYYELCSCQNEFLHEHLLEGLNCKLIAGVISETINIADAIRACKISTPEDCFSTWAKTLKAFECLGMNVGFLLTRLDQLASLASKARRLKEGGHEIDQAEEEMKSLEVKDAMNILDSDIETINTSSQKLELMFQDAAKAPW